MSPDFPLDANSCPQIIYYGSYRTNAGLRLKKGGFFYYSTAMLRVLTGGNLLRLHLEMCYKMSGVLKAGYLMLGALPNTFKVPVNGYKNGRKTIYEKETQNHSSDTTPV